MNTFLYKNRTPIGLSVALHLLVLILVFVKMPSKGQSVLASAAPAPAPAQQPAPVQATAVNSAEVAKQIQAIQQRELIKDQKETAAKEASQREEAHVQQLKAEQEKMKEAKVLRQKELAELSHKAAVEKMKLAALQKAQEKKLKAEEAAAKKLKIQEAARKKQELAKKSQELQQKLLAQQLAQENSQLKKMQNSDKPAAKPAPAQVDPGMVNQYTQKILGAIGDNWNIAPGTSKELKVQYLIHVGPDGTVISATLVKTSGDPLLDDSAKVAIMKSSPLPVPKDSADFEHFREFRLTLSPQHVKELTA